MRNATYGERDIAWSRSVSPENRKTRSNLGRQNGLLTSPRFRWISHAPASGWENQGQERLRTVRSLVNDRLRRNADAGHAFQVGLVTPTFVAARRLLTAPNGCS